MTWDNNTGFYDWAVRTHPDVVASYHREQITQHDAALATVEPSRLHIVEPIPDVDPVPADPEDQVRWIADRLSDGHDMTKAELQDVLAEAGVPASPSTAQRRLRQARALVAEPAAV